MRAHCEPACPVRFRVGAHHVGGDAVALEYAGRAEAVVEALGSRQRLEPVGVTEARDVPEPHKLDERLHLVLDEHARGIAGPIALDRHRGNRRDGVAADAGAAQRLGVGAGD
jgi:hypothetical protein